MFRVDVQLLVWRRRLLDNGVLRLRLCRVCLLRPDATADNTAADGVAQTDVDECTFQLF